MAAQIRSGALVGYPCQFASRHHCLYLVLVVEPVLVEHARCARHGEQIGIRCQGVLAQRTIARPVGTQFGVVVLDEGHCPTAVRATAVSAACQWPVAIVLLSQFAPVVLVNGIAHNILELEVESGTLLAGGINPVSYRGCTVPALADRILYACIVVIVGNMRAVETLHHIIAEARISEVVLQILDVCLHDVLHVLALVVEVAHAAPSLAFIVVAAQRHAVLCCLCGGGTVIVVGNNIGSLELIGHSFICLCRESPPAIGVVMVHHNIGNGADTLRLESLNHRAQLCLGAETAVLVEEIIRGIAHGVPTLKALSALRNPDEVERRGKVVCLTLQFCPFRLCERVPIETLQHNAAVVLGPSLCTHGLRAQHQQNRCYYRFQKVFHNLAVLLFTFPSAKIAEKPPHCS